MTLDDIIVEYVDFFSGRFNGMTTSRVYCSCSCISCGRGERREERGERREEIGDRR